MVHNFSNFGHAIKNENCWSATITDIIKYRRSSTYVLITFRTAERNLKIEPKLLLYVPVMYDRSDCTIHCVSNQWWIFKVRGPRQEFPKAGFL